MVIFLLSLILVLLIILLVNNLKHQGKINNKHIWTIVGVVTAIFGAILYYITNKKTKR